MTYRSIIVVLCILACGVTPASAADAPSAPLQPRIARASRPVNITWSGNPLRQALSGLSKAEGVPVLIDRRVDPGREVHLALDQKPLGAALLAIAQNQGLGLAMVGPVAYFAPPQAAAKIRTVVLLRTEEVRKLTPTASRAWLQPKPLAWPDFATPRDLLNQLSSQHELILKGAEQVPHDLWAAADLPPLPLVERLTLIAAQFDLTFQVSADGKAVAFVPMPDDVAIERAYEGGRQPQTVARQYAALAPEAQIKVAGGKVLVTGLLEDHERIAAPPRPAKEPPPRPPAPVNPAAIRFDKFVVKDALAGKVLEAVATKGLDVRIDQKALAAAGISLDAPITVNVRDVTIDQLLQEIARAARLRIQRRGNVVTVGPP